MDVFYYSKIDGSEKTIEGKGYYLSNSRKRKSLIYTEPLSFRYLIADDGGKG